MDAYLCTAYVFFFQAEDGIRDLVRSRGLGDVYKRQEQAIGDLPADEGDRPAARHLDRAHHATAFGVEGLSLIHI